MSTELFFNILLFNFLLCILLPLTHMKILAFLVVVLLILFVNLATLLPHLLTPSNVVMCFLSRLNYLSLIIRSLTYISLYCFHCTVGSRVSIWTFSLSFLVTLIICFLLEILITGDWSLHLDDLGNPGTKQFLAHLDPANLQQHVPSVCYAHLGNRMFSEFFVIRADSSEPDTVTHPPANYFRRPQNMHVG
jgi:hypothetical protein